MAIKLFISHSSADAPVASALIDLLRAGLNLPADAIRCTSADGYRLPGGARTDDHLRREVHEAQAFIGIVSAGSIRSLYVLFELGARWGAGRHLLPVLAPGVGFDVLQGPLTGINALKSDVTAQIHQLVTDIGSELGIVPAPPATYQAQVDRVLALPPTSDSGDVRGGENSGLARPLNLEERDSRSALPADAREVLLAAADDPSGAVFVTDSMQGTQISVGPREFVRDRLPRSEAKWRRAVSDLQSLGLIENRGGDGSLLSVTDEGFRIADLLRSLGCNREHR